MAQTDAPPENWKDTLKRSSEDFDRLVKPIASRILRGHFEIVESVTATPTAQALDTMAGIDIWFVNTTGGIRGIANRVQWGDTYWRTFTVRKETARGGVTEYAKRMRALAKEWLYPILTLQAYVTSDRSRLLGFGVAKTRDILSLIDPDNDGTRHTSKYNRPASFYVVKWDDIIRAGRPLVEYPHR